MLLNKNCAVAMMAAFNEIWEHCNHDQEQVDKAGASDYGGCFNIRRIVVVIVGQTIRGRRP